MVTSSRVQIFGKSIASLSLAHSLQKHGINFRFFDAIPKSLDNSPKGKGHHLERYALSKHQTLCIAPKYFSNFQKALDEDKFTQLRHLIRDQAWTGDAPDWDHPSKESYLENVWTTTATLENSLNALLDSTNRAKPGVEEAIPFWDSKNDELRGDDGTSDQVVNVLADAFDSNRPLTNLGDDKPGQDLPQNNSLSVSGFLFCTPDEYQQWLHSDPVSRGGHFYKNVNSREANGDVIIFQVWQDLLSDTKSPPDSVVRRLATDSDSSPESRTVRLRYMLSIWGHKSLRDRESTSALHQNEQVKHLRTTFDRTVHRSLLWHSLQRLTQIQAIVDVGIANAIRRIFTTDSVIDILSTKTRLLSKESLHQQQQNNVICIGAAAHAAPFAGPSRNVGKVLATHIIDGVLFADCIVQHGATIAALGSFYDQRYPVWESWQRSGHDALHSSKPKENIAKPARESHELSARQSVSSTFDGVDAARVNEDASANDHTEAAVKNFPIRRTAGERDVKHVQLSRNSLATLDYGSSSMPRLLLDLSTPLKALVPRQTSSPDPDEAQPISALEETTSSDTTSPAVPITNGTFSKPWQSQGAYQEYYTDSTSAAPPRRPFRQSPFLRKIRGQNTQPPDPLTGPIISHLDQIVKTISEELAIIGHMLENLSRPEVRIRFPRGDAMTKGEQRRRGYGRGGEDWTEVRPAFVLDLQRAEYKHERGREKRRDRREKQKKKRETVTESH